MTSKNRKIVKKNWQNSEKFFLRRRFDDFDKLSESIQDLNLGFRQLDRGRFNGDVLQLRSGPVLLSHLSFNRRIEIWGTTPQGFKTFGIPREISLAITWCGKVLEKQSIQFYPSGAELEGTIPPGFTTFTLSIAEEWLAELAPSLGLPRPQELPRQPEAFHVHLQELQRFQEILHHVTHTLTKSPSELETPRFRNELAFEIPQQLLTLLSRGHPASIKPAPARRNRALKQALVYITDHANEPPVIRNICQAIDVSQKTLEYAFLDHFGITPKMYLQVYRLNEVRKTLRQADPDCTKIADVANHWGFWHMGQFAKDYHKLFGELPSETLKHST